MTRRTSGPFAAANRRNCRTVQPGSINPLSDRFNSKSRAPGLWFSEVNTSRLGPGTNLTQGTTLPMFQPVPLWSDAVQVFLQARCATLDQTHRRRETKTVWRDSQWVESNTKSTSNCFKFACTVAHESIRHVLKFRWLRISVHKSFIK